MERAYYVVGAITAAIMLSGCATQRESAGAPSREKIAPHRMIAFTTNAAGEERPSVLAVPAGYNPRREWPLIVFLHGIGERGSDGVKQVEVGIGPWIGKDPARFPALVLMPQCAGNATWRSESSVAQIDAALDYVLKNYVVDERRIVLTGLSMGAFGAFAYGADNVDRFAAIVPVCGRGDPGRGSDLAKVPMWVFHGALDSVVPPEGSRVMVEAIKAAGGDVRYTEYPDLNHNSWDATYSNPEVIAWMLAQKRGR